MSWHNPKYFRVLQLMKARTETTRLQQRSDCANPSEAAERAASTQVPAFNDGDNVGHIAQGRCWSQVEEPTDEDQPALSIARGLVHPDQFALGDYRQLVCVGSALPCCQPRPYDHKTTKCQITICLTRHHGPYNEPCCKSSSETTPLSHPLSYAAKGECKKRRTTP